MSARRPDVVCMVRTTSSMAASCSGVAWTTRSGPSSTMVRSSSVTREAISTMTWRAGSSPVISRSIQASMRGHATGRVPGRGCVGQPPPCNVRRCCASRCTSSTPSSRCPRYARTATPAPTSWPACDVGAGLRGGRALVPTGVAVAIPAGYAGFVLPRSGLAARHGVTCLNTPGSGRLGLPGRAAGRAGQPRPGARLHGQPGRPHRPARHHAGRAGGLRAGGRGRPGRRPSGAAAGSATPAPDGRQAGEERVRRTVMRSLVGMDAAFLSLETPTTPDARRRGAGARPARGARARSSRRRPATRRSAG